MLVIHRPVPCPAPLPANTRKTPDQRGAREDHSRPSLVTIRKLSAPWR